MVSDGERAQVETQGVPTGRCRPGLLFAQLRERFRGRGPACSALCSHVHAPCSWAMDCTVPGGSTSPLERRRARARVGRSRVAYIGVCAVSAREG